MINKITLVPLLALFQGCATSYIPSPEIDRPADLVLPTKESSWKFFGGFSNASVVFGFADEKGCGNFFKSVPPKNDGDSSATVKIPSGKPVFVGFFANDGNWVCNVKGHFTPEFNKIYKVVKAGGGYRCQIGIVEMTAEDKFRPIELGKLHTNSLTGAVCIK